MHIEDLDAHWHALSEEVMAGMKDWRVQHQKATFRRCAVHTGYSRSFTHLQRTAPHDVVQQGML